jgi:ATP-dependent DNA helicase RecG
MKSICAFANDINNWGGGYIVIGVKADEGVPLYPISGIVKGSVDKINRELLNVCNLLKPKYFPISDCVEFEGKSVFILWVPGGELRPYKCPVSLSKGAQSAYYVRRFANTVRATENDERDLFNISNNVPFDDQRNLSAEVDDLRPMLISNFLKRVGSNLYSGSKIMPLTELTKAMRIVGGPEEDLRPLNVGLLFFNEQPDYFFRYARIEVVDKPYPTGIGMTEKYFSGPVDVQLRDALNYISNYIIKEKTFKYPDRAEADRFANFPFVAVEEALSNAVHHRSYQIAEPIIVTVTPEEMVIQSNPGPDSSISDEDIKSLRMVSRTYRNRRIGDFLKELELVEARNTGIPLIIRALEINGSEPPIFSTDAARSYFAVTFKTHKAFTKNGEKKYLTEMPIIFNDVGEISENVGESALEPEPVVVSKNDIDIVIINSIIRNKFVAIPELTQLTGRTSRTIERHLRALQDNSIIKREGPDRGGHWEVLK